MKRFLILVAVTVPVWAQMNGVSGERIRAHVKFLSSDLLEGRGPGARGGDLATEYLATQLALIGAKPAGDQGTYFQNFTLVGVDPQPETTLTAVGSGGQQSFKWLDDFVGVTYQQKADAAFDADVIFVGHGITAPEYNWDDYKDTDVRGKVVVLFTGEPPSNDPKFFTGAALTYYGRWTYKYENATRHGAAAVIIIHTTPTASYGWEVVRSSWGREDQQVKLDSGAPALAFAGWVTTAVGERIAGTIGSTVDELLKRADTRGFKPVALPFKFRGRAPAKVREVKTRNVIGRIEGSDPVLKNEVVIFSAHWDHLGIGQPVSGDAIYNGAADNATGCAMILEMARAWAGLPEKPRRSALFLAVSAEEAGMRGSNFYGQHPVVPAGKTAAALNFDQFLPFGRARDVKVNGAERTTLYPIVEEAAKRFGFTISPDSRPAAGTYYRSDHFSFARVGIPAFSVDGGEDLLGKPAGEGKKLFEDFNEHRYHQPSDEYKDDWDFSGMEQYARFGLLIGVNVANSPKLPTWKAGDEFLAARVASGVK
ncbi:MAG TPA: M28 family peptidase [Bryobacteraceae bacterium]|jgi:Zn-dependent M28 family amino/carboxypeptidase|nr:M28 family peptidase [Bryobacteraceae bacterium]